MQNHNIKIHQNDNLILKIRWGDVNKNLTGVSGEFRLYMNGVLITNTPLVLGYTPYNITLDMVNILSVGLYEYEITIDHNCILKGSYDVFKYHLGIISNQHVLDIDESDTNVNEIGEFTPNVQLPSHTPVYINSAGALIAAISGRDSQVIGLTISEGNTSRVASTGYVTNQSWNWTRGKAVFINGASLSQTAPTTGVIHNIGVATDTDSILLNIQPMIIL